jgi:hypothetical protein
MRVVNEVNSQLKLHLERLFQEHYQADYLSQVLLRDKAEEVSK